MADERDGDSISWRRRRRKGKQRRRRRERAARTSNSQCGAESARDEARPPRRRESEVLPARTRACVSARAVCPNSDCTLRLAEDGDCVAVRPPPPRTPTPSLPKSTHALISAACESQCKRARWSRLSRCLVGLPLRFRGPVLRLPPPHPHKKHTQQVNKIK